jgi:hypothetical protein
MLSNQWAQKVYEIFRKSNSGQIFCRPKRSGPIIMAFCAINIGHGRSIKIASAARLFVARANPRKVYTPAPGNYCRHSLIYR